MFKSFLKLASGLAFISIVLCACQSQTAGMVTNQTSPAPETAAPAPTATPEPPKISLYYVGQNAQVELTSPQGIRVLIDVAYPSMLSSPPTDKDILLTSHFHADHRNVTLTNTFPGQQLFAEEGEIVAGDVTIHSIVTGHAVTVFGAASQCDNAVFIINMGGLRIVHFGDFGQEQLTPELAAALGKVDVAINLLGEKRIFRPTLEEKTMFKFMAQLKPRLIIPTDHSNVDSIGIAIEQWQGFYSVNNPVAISSADLSDETKVLVLGVLASSYQKLYNLQPWDNLAANR